MASQFTAGGPTDFAPFDILANVLLTQVVMQGNLWAFQDPQEFALVGMQALEGQIQGGITGFGREERIKSDCQCLLLSFGGSGFVGFQIVV